MRVSSNAPSRLCRTVSSTWEEVLQLCRSGLISGADMLAPSVSGLFKWIQFEPEVILLAVGWYLRFSLSYRDVEELLAERGLHQPSCPVITRCPGADYRGRYGWRRDADSVTLNFSGIFARTRPLPDGGLTSQNSRPPPLLPCAKFSSAIRTKYTSF
jgi:hypothetical protein